MPPIDPALVAILNAACIVLSFIMGTAGGQFIGHGVPLALALAVDAMVCFREWRRRRP